jgi:hypothetical protein
VLYLPVNQGGNHIDLSYFQQPLNLLGLTAHHRKSPNGLSGFVPPSYFKNSRRFRTLPDAASLRLLRHLGVRFVVVHANVEGGPWAKLRDPEHAKPLKYLGAYGEALLYEVPQV